MPELARFYGIIIAMDYNDHAPPISVEWWKAFSALALCVLSKFYAQRRCVGWRMVAWRMGLARAWVA